MKSDFTFPQPMTEKPPSMRPPRLGEFGSLNYPQFSLKQLNPSRGINIEEKSSNNNIGLDGDQRIIGDIIQIVILLYFK